MEKIKKLSLERQIPILLFLWRWKLSTTGAIAAKFFSGKSLHTAYKRLRELRAQGLIAHKFIDDYETFLWVLTKKGFERILGKIPYELKEDGFRSENLSHDFITTAAHLGDWLQEIPKGCALFSEQELRRLEEEHYPDWVPRCEFYQADRLYHRPDGYWYVEDGESKLVLALEIEKHQQKNSRYYAIGRYYSSQVSIYRVMWLVASQAIAKNISKKMKSHLKDNEDYHNFILIEDFFKNGWQAKIFIGPDQNQTIAKVLKQQGGEKGGESQQNKPYLPLLDSRKNPTTSKHFNNTPKIQPIVCAQVSKT